MDENFVEIIITIITTIFASSGFWLFIEKNSASKNIRTKLLVGLAHHQIVQLCIKYISQGWISQDEYEDLCQFLYTPYIEMGGNGTAKRLMDEVDKLPVISRSQYQEKTQPKKELLHDSQQ